MKLVLCAAAAAPVVAFISQPAWQSNSLKSSFTAACHVAEHVRPAAAVYVAASRRRQRSQLAMALDYYVVLGLSETATKAEVKRAYRKAALKNHPDVNDAPNARAKFMVIVTAYETLYDDKKRADYDRKRRMSNASAGSSSSRSSYSSSSSGSSSARSTYDPARAERERQWREANPTRKDIDDSFTKIFGDILGGIAGGAVGGVNGGRGIINDFVEFLESQVDDFGSGTGAELDDLLTYGSASELRAEADNARLLVRQLKKKLLSVGEECSAAERAAAAAQSSGGRRPVRDMEELDRQMEIVDRAAGLRARFDGLKTYLKRAETRLRRLERRLEGMGESTGAASSSSSSSGSSSGSSSSGSSSSARPSSSAYSYTPPRAVKSRDFTQLNPAVENELDALKKKLGL
jgi:uncharacterized membrane protein YgcG